MEAIADRFCFILLWDVWVSIHTGSLFQYTGGSKALIPVETGSAYISMLLWVVTIWKLNIYQWRRSPPNFSSKLQVVCLGEEHSWLHMLVPTGIHFAVSHTPGWSFSLCEDCTMWYHSSSWVSLIQSTPSSLKCLNKPEHNCVIWSLQLRNSIAIVAEHNKSRLPVIFIRNIKCCFYKLFLQIRQIHLSVGFPLRSGAPSIVSFIRGLYSYEATKI